MDEEQSYDEYEYEYEPESHDSYINFPKKSEEKKQFEKQELIGRVLK
jgi:hypothetical protein